MRDGPPTESTSETYSTSTLLKEISSLRSRLRELEDDTRSNVSGMSSGVGFIAEKEGELVNMLRKELAKVEHEKANLEKEFMNQLSSIAKENRNATCVLQDKLVRSQALNEALKDQLKSKLQGDAEAERLMQLVEEERENHAKEMDQMKQTIASSDMEIADSRREMDNLHEQLEEVHAEKEELQREVTDLRLAYSEEQRRSESLRTELKQSNETVSKLQKEVSDKDEDLKKWREEVGEMNDTLIGLEDHKQLLVSENKDLRLQLNKRESLKKSPSDVDLGKYNITCAEKEKLEGDLVLLEGRLEQLQTKLEERDTTIDNLAATLTEERKNPQRTKQQSTREKETPNKATSRPSLTLSLSSSPSSTARKTSNFLESPRTPVSGIVASFEKRIHGNNATTTATREEPVLAVAPPLMESRSRQWSLEDERESVVGLQEKLRQEKELVKTLRIELDSASEESVRKDARLQIQLNEKTEEIARLRAKSEIDGGTLLDLQDKLRHEQALVKELRVQLSDALASDNNKHAELEKQLAESRREVDVLVAQIEGYQSARATIQEKTRNEQAELSKLRMKAHQATSEKRDLENKVVASQREVERLKTELSHTLDMYSYQDEKKEEECEEVERLQSQASSLQTELDAAMAEIDNLLAEMEGLRNALRTEQRAVDEARKKSEDVSLSKKTQKLYDSQINQLKVELTKTQIAKHEVETEYEKKVKELEDEMEALVAEAEEEIEESSRQLDSLKATLAEKEAQIARLEVEQTQINRSMNNMSASRMDEMEDLQAELISTTSKMSVQVREIDMLKMKIQELQAQKQETEERSKQEIRALEEASKLQRHDLSKQDIEQLKSENIKLRESIRDVKLERRIMKERLDSLTMGTTSSKSTQLLRDRNTELKDEVDKLTKRLKKMEASITRFAI